MNSECGVGVDVDMCGQCSRGYFWWLHSCTEYVDSGRWDGGAWRRGARYRLFISLFSKLRTSTSVYYQSGLRSSDWHVR